MMRWCRICGLALLFLLLTSHPIHAYERDVHYDLTKYLVRWAGFPEDEAEQIATADQEIDAKPEFNPLPNPNFCPKLSQLAALPTPAIIQATCKDDPEFQRMLTAQRAYHFVDSERLQALRDNAFRGRNLKTLGHYLHALQDSFAHSLMDYADLPPLDKLVANLGRLPDEKVIGHFLYGHSLDRTYERPDLAEQMARYVFAELVRFKGSVNRWNELEATVARFVREKDGQSQLRYLAASSPSLPPDASSQPSGLPTKAQEPMHEGRTFAEWQADLRDASSKVREKAAKALGHFGLEAVPILAQTLKDTNADVRWAAAHALGEIGPAAKNAVPALVQALEDVDGMVRARAKTTLRRIDPAALEEWERAGKRGAKEEARPRKEAAQRQASTRSRGPCKEEFLDDFDAGGWAAMFAMQSGTLRPCPQEGDEEKKAAANQLNVAFTRKHGVRESVACEALSRNPFAYEGKVVALNVTFEQMIARDRGLFGVGGAFEACGVAVSGIPHGVFSSQRVRVVLAGRVLGNTEVKIGPATLQVPHLQYVGVHICKEGDCADFFGPASMR